MRNNIKCPFCGQIITENNSKSKEHILPESLGNKDEKFIFDKGIICDKCNNYFSRNIEEDFLNLQTIKLLRSYNRIPSKKNKIPSMDALICGDIAKVVFHHNRIILECEPETCIKIFNNKPEIIFSKCECLDELQESYVVSRFLAKVCSEYLILLCIHHKVNYNDFIAKSGVKKLYEYVRYGSINGDVFNYSVEKYKDIKTSISDDVFCSIDMDYKEKDMKMIFTLYTLKFILYLGKPF
ncbi:MAG: HNH endonuclease [Bacilli bacterium]